MTAPMDDDMAAVLWREMREHADDTITGACPRCERMLCPEYVEARVLLTMAGHVTPLEEPRGPELPPEYGQGWSQSQAWARVPTSLLPVIRDGLKRL